ncbi:MAG: hypothetical protein ACMZI0_07145 [Symbiopectobacterium sp.]
MHHTDRRVQANLGLGMRHVTHNVIVGGQRLSRLRFFASSCTGRNWH